MVANNEMSAADAAFLLDALRHVINPVVINAGEIAAKTDARLKTVVNRFWVIKNRYNINIQTTSAGYSPPKGVKIEKKARGRPPNKNRVKGTSVRDAAIKSLLEEDEVPSQRKASGRNRLPTALEASAWDEDVTPSE